ncbi:MAG: hypothetical protein U0T81_05045 [Saprospiraceae bacterium]
MPKSNDYFGDKYGVVKLSDHNGNSTLSTDPYLNKKVQVFFERCAQSLNPVMNQIGPIIGSNLCDKTELNRYNLFKILLIIALLLFLALKLQQIPVVQIDYRGEQIYGQAISQTFSIEPKNKGIHNLRYLHMKTIILYFGKNFGPLQMDIQGI